MFPPPREGIKGCVMVRDAAKADGLRDTVSRRLVLQGGICQTLVVALVFRRLCLGVTHPQPLSRGEIWDAVFLLVMSGLWRVGFPSREGIKGGYGEGRGLGRWVARSDWA